MTPPPPLGDMRKDPNMTIALQLQCNRRKALVPWTFGASDLPTSGGGGGLTTAAAGYPCLFFVLGLTFGSHQSPQVTAGFLMHHRRRPRQRQCLCLTTELQAAQHKMTGGRNESHTSSCPCRTQVPRVIVRSPARDQADEHSHETKGVWHRSNTSLPHPPPVQEANAIVFGLSIGAKVCEGEGVCFVPGHSPTQPIPALVQGPRQAFRLLPPVGLTAYQKSSGQVEGEDRCFAIRKRNICRTVMGNQCNTSSGKSVPRDCAALIPGYTCSPGPEKCPI